MSSQDQQPQQPQHTQPKSLAALDAVFRQVRENERSQRTLVLENIHACTTVDKLFFFMEKYMKVAAKDVAQFSIRNVKKDGHIERLAFVEFHDWQVAFEAKQRYGNKTLRFPCLPPRPHQAGLIVDQNNQPVDTSRLESTPECGKFYFDVSVRRQKCFNGFANCQALTGNEWICSLCILPNSFKVCFCCRCGSQMDHPPAPSSPPKQAPKKKTGRLGAIIATRLRGHIEKPTLVRHRRQQLPVARSRLSKILEEESAER